MTIATTRSRGINGEMLNDESSLFSKLYGGRVNIGEAANILQRTIASALIVNIPPDKPLTFLGDLGSVGKQHEHGAFNHLLKSIIVDLRVLAGMTGDAAFMTCPDTIDAVPGFRSIVLPTQTAERSELERQGAAHSAEHALDSFNTSRWRIIKREQLPENVLHFILETGAALCLHSISATWTVDN